MTDRKTIDQMTSDDLDQLYDELAALRTVARGYCPTCGRGDAAPTVADWEEQKRRADNAEEGERRMLAQRQEMAEERYIWQERGDRAEAAITRVRAIAGWAINGWSDLSPQKVLDAIDTENAPAATQATERDEFGLTHCPRCTDAVHDLKQHLTWCTETDGIDTAEPDTCRSVEVDGETIRVRGAGEFTDRDREFAAEIVRAAKRKFEAEPAAVQLRWEIAEALRGIKGRWNIRAQVDAVMGVIGSHAQPAAALNPPKEPAPR